MEFFMDIKDPGFKLELDKVFRGEIDCVGLKVPTAKKNEMEISLNFQVDTRRTMEANYMLMYFMKDMIKMKTLFFESNQRGYIYPVFEIAFCVRFYPTLGIMKYIKTHRRKNQSLHWNNCVYSKMLWDRLGEMDTVKRYLKYFDHPYPDNAWKNIIPTFTDFGFDQYDKSKKYWRQPTVKAILKDAGLPTSKGMIKVLNYRIGIAEKEDVIGFHQVLPQLRPAKIMWSLTHNIDMTKEALLSDWRVGDDIDIKTARKLFIKKGDPKSVVRLARSLMGTNGAYLIPDSVRLYKGIVKKTGEAPDVSGSFKEIHDKLAYLSGQIRDAKYNTALEHKDPLKAINGHRFKVGDTNYEFLLPNCPNDLGTWGNILSHCVGGSHYKEAIANNEMWLIGVVNVDTNKLVYVIQVRRGDVDQFKGWCNCYPSKAEYKTIIDLFFEFKLLSKKRFTDGENPSFGERLLDRAKKLNLNEIELPDVPVHNYPEYPDDVDIFDPGEGMPPLPVDTVAGNIVVDDHDTFNEDLRDFDYDHTSSLSSDLPF